MDDKRMIGDYTVLNSMYVGHKEIAICENPKAPKDERYLSLCFVLAALARKLTPEAAHATVYRFSMVGRHPTTVPMFSA